MISAIRVAGHPLCRDEGIEIDLFSFNNRNHVKGEQPCSKTILR